MFYVDADACLLVIEMHKIGDEVDPLTVGVHLEREVGGKMKDGGRWKESENLKIHYSIFPYYKWQDVSLKAVLPLHNHKHSHSICI